MRDGFIAKINRNGTFSTGMKKRISAPVDVLNAFVSASVRVPSGSGRPTRRISQRAEIEVHQRRHDRCPAEPARRSSPSTRTRRRCCAPARHRRRAQAAPVRQCEIRYSALNSRLLLPPTCTPESSDRAARPTAGRTRACCTRRRGRSSGRSGAQACRRRAGCIRPRRGTRSRSCGWSACTRSPRPAGCMNFVLPPSPAMSNDMVKRLPAVGKIGLSTVL